MKRIIPLALISILILSVCSFSVVSCSKQTPFFGLYLADSGELVLSGQDIQAWNKAENALVLNAQGIAKWNSYQTYTDIPKLDKTLYQRDFVMKLEGDEVCRGKFYSGVSSASLSGISIMDALFKLDSGHNKITLISDYPGSSLGAQYQDIGSKITEVFTKHNMLQ